jgi:predicted O-methyltransferase YrrM
MPRPLFLLIGKPKTGDTMKYINDKLVLNTLDSLYENASKDMRKMLSLLPKLIFKKLKPEDCHSAYLPIDKKQGEFLYDHIVSNSSKTIVEFGTSFGISTIYLASGAKESGGRVITSELLPEKCRAAKNNFKQCKLISYIDIREGDAMETLATIDEGIDLLLLDGWSDLYLPLLKLLEPKLNEGALIYADNASFPGMKPYLSYVNENPAKYSTELQKVSKGKVAITYKVCKPHIER